MRRESRERISFRVYRRHCTIGPSLPKYNPDPTDRANPTHLTSSVSWAKNPGIEKPVEQNNE